MTSELELRSDEPASTPANGVQRIKLVLIEDDEDIRAMLTLLLSHEGYEVAVAADGEAGIQLLEQTRPAAALVDIGLPGIDGYEVARRIRVRFGTSVWLVALTGYGQPADREASKRAGFDAHLVKPLRPGGLAKVLPARP